MPRTKKPTAAEIAERQAAEDAALLDALQARDAAATEPEPPKTTLVDLYGSIVDLVVEKRKTTRLSETTLVRLWELTLMWDLNNRNQQPSMPTWGGGSGDGEIDLPEIHERITADSQTSEA